jgi:putative FmdB family regulatory protein
MPIYEYECEKCANRFEVKRSFSQSDDPAYCEKCGESGKKLMSHFSAFNKGGSGSMFGIKGASGYTG